MSDVRDLGLLDRAGTLDRIVAVCKADDDPTLELVCQVPAGCGEVLCDVEDGDSLGTLCRMALSHLAECPGPAPESVHLPHCRAHFRIGGSHVGCACFCHQPPVPT